MKHENSYTVMNEEVEMPQLNIFQQYRHTVKLDRTTTRTTNKDWYREALDLEVQLHCYLSSEHVADCYLYIKSRQYYEEIGQLDLELLDQEESLQLWLQEMLKLNEVVSAKAKSLGVVFYLADDFSMAGLGPEYNDPDDLKGLRAQMANDPKEVLEDKSISAETHSWRLFPYAGAKPGAEFATAIATPRKWDDLLRSLRNIGDQTNFPIRTCSLSAPLCAIASLPWCASPCPQGTVGIFAYAKFTLLTCYNSESDLMMLRHIPHAQGSRVPRNLGPSVFATATACELENPEVYVFPMAEEGMERVVVSLQTAVKGSEIMLVESRDILNSRGVTADIPLEMMTTTHELDPQVYPLASNTTFSSFREDGWPLQDFLSPSMAELSSIPDAGAMRLLRISRWMKMLGALFFISVLSYSGWGIWQHVMSDVWQYQPENTMATQAKAIALNTKLNDYKRWDNLLQDRSKAWVTLELLNRLIPEDESIVLTKVKHTYQRDAAQKNKKTGFTKVWTVRGVADGKGIHYLEDFDTRDGRKIKKLFEAVADSTGNDAYRPSIHERDIGIKLSRSNNKKRTPAGEKARPYAFTLTITQNFAPGDPVNVLSK